MNRCGSFPLLSAPCSLFSIWTDLKKPENIPGAPARRWGERIWLTGPSGLHPNSPQELNISSIRVFLPDQRSGNPNLPSFPYLLYVCKVICPKAGLSLDMHYQASGYLSLLDKRKEWGSMSSPFLTEPLALWEYFSLHTHRHKNAANTTTKHPIPHSSQNVTVINGTEPSWELQILL